MPGPVALAAVPDAVIVTGVVKVPTGVTETVTQLLHAPPPSYKVPVREALKLNEPGAVTAVIVSGTEMEWESAGLVLVPVTVKVVAPAVAVDATETLKVTDPLPVVTLLPDTTALIPVGNPLALKVIGILASPPVCVTVMVMAPELLCASVSELATAKLKSPAVNVLKHTLTEVEKLPEVIAKFGQTLAPARARRDCTKACDAVTVKLAVPVAVSDTDGGLNAKPVTPVGAVTVMGPLKEGL